MESLSGCVRRKMVTQGARDRICVYCDCAMSLYKMYKYKILLLTMTELKRSWLSVQMIWNEIVSEKNWLEWIHFDLNGEYTHDKHFKPKYEQKKAKNQMFQSKQSTFSERVPTHALKFPNKKISVRFRFRFYFHFHMCPFSIPLLNSTNMLLAWLVQSNTSISVNHFYDLFLSTLLVISFFTICVFFRNGYLFPSKVYS